MYDGLPVPRLEERCGEIKTSPMKIGEVDKCECAGAFTRFHLADFSSAGVGTTSTACAMLVAGLLWADSLHLS
jgi:hypothetical protein